MTPRTPKTTSHPHRAWKRIALAATGVLLLVTLLALVLWFAVPLFRGPAITRLVVQGELRHVSPAVVRAAVLPVVAGKGFFQTNMHAAQAAVQSLPWVASVSVRRSWPHTLYINLVEEVPVARWNDAGLLDAQGRVFVRGDVSGYTTLPLLNGPEGSAPDVLADYNSFTALTTPRGIGITQLTLDARGAASVRLRDGIEVRLGREDAAQRLARFGAVALPALGAQLPSVAYVDMRYTNGFAVGWLDAGSTTPCRTKSDVASRNKCPPASARRDARQGEG